MKDDFHSSSLLNGLDSLLKPAGNQLTQARERRKGYSNTQSLLSGRQCALCGQSLYRTSYMALGQGRLCCHNCYESLVATQAEMEEIFAACKQEFEHFFGVQLPPITLFWKAPSARPAGSSSGISFFPFEKKEITAVYWRENGEHRLWLDNTISHLGSLPVLVQGMTLAWQQENWNKEMLGKDCMEHCYSHTKEAAQAVCTGMQHWAVVAYLHQCGEKSLACKYDHRYLYGRDAASAGYRLYCELYSFCTDFCQKQKTPFDGDGSQSQKAWPIDLVILERLLQKIMPKSEQTQGKPSEK